MIILLLLTEKKKHLWFIIMWIVQEYTIQQLVVHTQLSAINQIQLSWFHSQNTLMSFLILPPITDDNTWFTSNTMTMRVIKIFSNHWLFQSFLSVLLSFFFPKQVLAPGIWNILYLLEFLMSSTFLCLWTLNYFCSERPFLISLWKMSTCVRRTRGVLNA